VPEIIIVLDEYPTDATPAPLNDNASGRTDDVEEDAPVVLPTANRLRFGDGAETTTLEFDIPIETIPAPSNESEPAAFNPEDTDEVVLPTANNDSNGFVAAVEADTTRIPAAAPVVDTPTDTMPAPDIDIALSVCVLDEEIAVVLPDAK
jgi:hypothetical protein